MGTLRSGHDSAERRRWPRCALALLLSALLPSTIIAEVVSIPAGTLVYGEIEETVTSKKKDTSLGDIVRAHVWRNVSVDGRMVMRAGAPMTLRVSHVKKARVAGRKGQLELEAVAARSVDGADVLLDGGYDKSGHGRKALSITLGALIAWPLIFIKGKQAMLEAGTVFDAVVQADTLVRLQGDEPVRIRLGGPPELEALVLYDDMDPSGKDNRLPMILTRCGRELTSASVVTLNEQEIPPEELELEPATAQGDCLSARGTLALDRLAKHFRKGINRFEIEANGARVEVVLDIEL